MIKVLVLYYSSFGHIERMAEAEAEGARIAGAQVDVKRVPELVPRMQAQAARYKLDQVAPIARVDDLLEYDAVIFGTPTRYGNMAAQMKITATASQHGGQETTLISFHVVLMHLGFIVIGLPYTFKG